MNGGLFQKLDHVIFDLMLKVKTSAGYSKVQEAFNDLEDNAQLAIKYILIAICGVSPLIVVLVLFINVKGSQDNVRQFKEVLERVQHYGQARKNITNSTTRILARTPITSQADFTNRITLAANSAGVDLANIQANDFASETLPGNVQKSIIAIKFSKLSSDQLFTMLLSLAQAQNIKFENIEIKRNDQENLIQGLVTLNHFSKAANDESI